MQNMNHETTAATARHTALPDTVALEGEELVIIDQTELPRRLKLLHLSERYEIFEAIKSLRVRGAPAIGVAAAIGLYIAAHRKLTQEPDITSSAMLGHIAEERDYLASSRPTAVNLFWALDRMYARAASLADESPREITAGMRAEAVAALVALGYDGASAGRAVASVPDCDRVEDMIMQALRATTK